ncbi:MAG: hypothetical protein D6768_13255 [Chloroflexi bacterium]|nr:MAG: hypothetical protein D6768_13255 [Chloroflexota bacterium]
MEQQLLSERVGLYSLLRALYTYPLTQTVLDAVAQLQVAPESPLAEGLRQMQNSLRAATLDELNIEMTRLLEGPGLTPAPPYASYYLNNGQLMGPPAVAARQVYLQWQAIPEADTHLPDDHIALELGFAAHLAQRAVDGDKTALAAGRDFLRQHLLPWLSRFCDALVKAGPVPFFSGLAHLTRTAVQADLAWLDQILTETTVKTV